MGMVAKDAKAASETVKADAELRKIEAEYRQHGLKSAADHVHGARVLLEKARRLADSPRPVAAYN
jgi:hypothetical protein